MNAPDMPTAPDLTRLASMIDSVSDAIITIDSHGIIEYVNRGAQELFGYRPEEMLGRNVAMLMDAPDSLRHDAYIRAYLKTGQSRVMNHRRSVTGLRKDGSPVPLDLTLGQMVEDGEQKFTAVMRDVTEQRRLQHLAAEAERRLQEAKDRADEANRAKSVFLATMSHEIRTPMNGVLGSLELLGLSALNEEQRATVMMAEQSGRELLRILDDILDFSKIEAGRMELRDERTHLQEHVIDKVIATYAPLAARKGLELRSSIASDVAPWVSADPLRLRQILHNFVSNAVKFTMEGSIELSVESLEMGAHAQSLRFAVKDRGIGISPASQARLFKPFVQADGDTTRRFGGSGLGLAICLGLADSMSGRLSMTSAQGLGTTMALTVTLPIAAPAEPSAGAGATFTDTQPPTAAPAVEAAARDGQLVLVVDDHATNRNVLIRQLASLGYASESAANGVEALAMLAGGRYALMISDCQMPKMDGYTLARTIRRQEAADEGIAPLPIIAFTANAFASDAERALEAGMDDYLSKPTTIAALEALLKKHLPPASVVVDETRLADIVGDDAAARAELLADFLSSCDADIAAVRAACQAQDAAALAVAAHRLAGAARMIGAPRLAAAATAIERAARQQPGDISATCARLAPELAALTAYIEDTA